MKPENNTIIHKHYNDKQDSIEVSQNGKGEYSFHAKIYYNRGEEQAQTIIERIKDIYIKLQKKFPNAS